MGFGIPIVTKDGPTCQRHAKAPIMIVYKGGNNFEELMQMNHVDGEGSLFASMTHIRISIDEKLIRNLC